MRFRIIEGGALSQRAETAELGMSVGRKILRLDPPQKFSEYFFYRYAGNYFSLARFCL